MEQFQRRRAELRQVTAAPAAGRGAGQQAAPVPAGVTVAGEIKNYVPITDAMLQNPDPNDWLVIRHDQFASNYSPLNQITAANVGQLQLAWALSMNEGGTQQTAPLVHNGVIFANNTGGIIQAVDARKGKVIWQYNTGGPNIAARGIALYQDKVIFMMSNGHLKALDARNGKEVWDAVTWEGHGSSSGPLIAKGKVIQGMGGCAAYVLEKCRISAFDAATGKPAWAFNTIAKTGERGGDSWGKNNDFVRAGGETWITGSFDPCNQYDLLGDRAGQTLDARKPRDDDRRQSSIFQLYGCSRRGFRRIEVVLPARARRNHGSRHRLRAPSRGFRRPESMFSLPERTAFSGSWTARPGSISVIRRWSSRMSGVTSIRLQASPTTAKTLPRRRSGNGSMAAPAPTAEKIGRR